MTTIQIDGQLEQRLKRAAASSGTEPQAVATQVLDENLPRANDATLKLLAEWEAEDATTDSAELERRREEGEELMRNLDRNRIESQGIQVRSERDSATENANASASLDEQYRQGYEQIPEDISDIEALIPHLPLPKEKW